MSTIDRLRSDRLGGVASRLLLEAGLVADGRAGSRTFDPDERRRVMAPLMRSMGVIAGMFGRGNPWRDTPEEIARKCEGMPLVRVRATGIAAGPEDPGGRYWIVPRTASAIVTVWWLRGRRGRHARG
jgi:hypothetical protein